MLPKLRKLASDPRWRVREGVAMAMQRLGASDMAALLAEMRAWAKGNDYERRAAAAALCEPVLLKREEDVREVLAILDGSPTTCRARARAGARGSCPAQGPRLLLERRRRRGTRRRPTADGAMDAERGSDVSWVMKQNLKKKRLTAAGADWVATWSAKLNGRS